MSFRERRVFLSVPFYMVFEYLLFKYLFLIVGGVDDIYLISVSVFLGLNRFIPMIFEARKSRKVTRFLTTVDGVWMWFSLMFFIDIIIIYFLGFFIKLPMGVNIALLAVVPILGIYNYWKGHKLVVNEKTLTLPNLNHDVRIAHLSDIHFGSVRHKKLISEISDRLNSIDCDLAIISGDLADGSSVIFRDDFSAFADVEIPIIFTPGNHDFYPGIESVLEAGRHAGIIVLDNESLEINGLNIYGKTYSREDKVCPKIDESVIKDGMVNIINYHVPFCWEEFSDLGFDIQLSGHTHGGQFYPGVWISKRLFGYSMGLFKDEKGRYLHVTTGIGSMDMPMRWGTDSEIVVLNLKKL